MINTDIDRERLRERLTEPRDDYHHGYCLNCESQLTSADVEAGECTACGSSIDVDDEHLRKDGYGDE